MRWTRRELLATSAAAGAVLAMPRWLRADGPPARPRRTVVLLHLVGGNDGLNTVVPARDPLYRRLRPSIAVGVNEVLPLADGLALHPALGGLAALWQRERLAVVSGLGYPRPDYSHFRATEIWYTAEPERAPRTGWVGRAIDARASTAPLRAAAFAKEPPLSLVGETPGVATVSDFDRFRLPAGIADVAALYREAAGAGGALGGVGRAGEEALAVAERIARLRPAQGPYQGPLGETLKRVVALLEADLGLEAIQCSFDGFDTHANQARLHRELLGALGQNLRVFQDQVESRGLADRVVLLAFSEFGRRPAENASGGTDHGHAAPAFLVGKGVRPGLHGAPPSLEDLDDGNLRHTTDFRRLYAALLRDALALDPAPVVGAHEPLEVLT
jgi:uncharacterized protein (DUF1501 family)